jgi:HSP20 family protein
MERTRSRRGLLQKILTMQPELRDLFMKTFGPDPFAVDFDPERWEKWAPKTDLYKRNGEWVVRVELPGVNPDEVSLSVIDNRLLIEGERKPPEGFKPENSIFQESPYGPFERVVTFPSPVLENQIKASYENGILDITLPAIEQEKNIEIQSEEPPKEKSKAA